MITATTETHQHAAGCAQQLSSASRKLFFLNAAAIFLISMNPLFIEILLFEEIFYLFLAHQKTDV
jgi:hypothetical protein